MEQKRQQDHDKYDRGERISCIALNINWHGVTMLYLKVGCLLTGLVSGV